MPIRALIFDLDGTLVDTNPTHIEAWRRAFAERGHDIPAERIRAEMGKGGDQLVPAILGDGVSESDAKKLTDGHAANFMKLAGERKFRIFPGAAELLAECRRRKLPTALATSSGATHLEAIAKSCGRDFGEQVDELVSADDAEKSKPHPDLVSASADKLGVPPGDCAMLGDTVYDGEACRKAGVHFWAVLCGGTASREELEASGAEWAVLDPAQLLEQLDEALAQESAAAMG